jgi:hypothetical protein
MDSVRFGLVDPLTEGETFALLDTVMDSVGFGVFNPLPEGEMLAL